MEREEAASERINVSAFVDRARSEDRSVPRLLRLQRRLIAPDPRQPRRSLSTSTALA